MRACAECGKQVSAQAPTCPHCGAKQRKPTGLIGYLFTGAVVLMVGSCIYNKSTAPDAPVVAAAPVDPHAAQRMTMAIGALRVLKRTLRDPDSLAVDSVSTDSDGNSGCISYRARNGFGGMNLEVVGWDATGFHQDRATVKRICDGAGFNESGAVRQM